MSSSLPSYPSEASQDYYPSLYMDRFVEEKFPDRRDARELEEDYDIDMRSFKGNVQARRRPVSRERERLRQGVNHDVEPDHPGLVPPLFGDYVIHTSRGIHAPQFFKKLQKMEDLSTPLRSDYMDGTLWDAIERMLDTDDTIEIIDQVADIISYDMQ